MAERKRRLWLGEWQSGQDEDQVLITPVDEEGAASEPVAAHSTRNRNTAIITAVAALVFLAFVLGSGGGENKLSAAVTDVPPFRAPQFQAPPQASPTPQTVPPPGGFGGAQDLSDAAAEKAARAALRKYPGDIERVTRGPSGTGYVVHVFQDGYEIHVGVSDEFKVLGSDAPAPPGGGVPQGGGASDSS